MISHPLAYVAPTTRQRHYICELCNAILLQGIIYVNYAMPCCLAKRHICELYHAILFCISRCICRQCLYIKLLFLCIHHLNWWWRNLEWKQGLHSRQCYLSKQISCWVPIAPQRWIQRQMTSPIIPLRCMLKLGRVILLISSICCIAYHAYVVLQCLVFT